MDVTKAILNNKFVGIFPYGSKVYQTNTLDSDDDYIIITRNKYEDKTTPDIQYYTIEEFQLLLDKHDVIALECFFLPNNLKKLDLHPFTFNLDKPTLRTSISTIASNSWVKGRKKLTIEGDYDVKIAIKSYFHSLRILNFGTQIAMHGKIVDYSALKYIIEDLREMSKIYSGKELSNAIETKYKSVYNSLSTTFKKMCPKDTNYKDLKANIRTILKRWDIDNSDLLNEIMLELNK